MQKLRLKEELTSSLMIISDLVSSVNANVQACLSYAEFVAIPKEEMNFRFSDSNAPTAALASFLIFISTFPKPKDKQVYKYVSQNLNPEAFAQTLFSISQIGVFNNHFINNTKRYDKILNLAKKIYPETFKKDNQFLVYIYGRSIVQLGSTTNDILEKYLSVESFSDWETLVSTYAEKLNLSSSITSANPGLTSSYKV